MKETKNGEKRGMISFWVPYEMHKNIKRMGIDNGVTMRDFFYKMPERALFYKMAARALKEHTKQR